MRLCDARWQAVCGLARGPALTSFAWSIVFGTNWPLSPLLKPRPTPLDSFEFGAPWTHCLLSSGGRFGAFVRATQTHDARGMAQAQAAQCGQRAQSPGHERDDQSSSRWRWPHYFAAVPLQLRCCLRFDGSINAFEHARDGHVWAW